MKLVADMNGGKTWTPASWGEILSTRSPRGPGRPCLPCRHSDHLTATATGFAGGDDVVGSWRGAASSELRQLATSAPGFIRRWLVSTRPGGARLPARDPASAPGGRPALVGLLTVTCGTIVSDWRREAGASLARAGAAEQHGDGLHAVRASGVIEGGSLPARKGCARARGGRRYHLHAAIRALYVRLPGRPVGTRGPAANILTAPLGPTRLEAEDGRQRAGVGAREVESRPVTSDAQMIDSGCAGGPHTQQAYAADAEQFLQALQALTVKSRMSERLWIAWVWRRTRRRHLAWAIAAGVCLAGRLPACQRRH